MNSRHQKLLCCLLLGVVTLVVYWPLSNHEFYNVDDQQYILQNPNVTSGLTWKSVLWALGSGYACNWHPLTWISHMVDCSLYGLNPPGHHFSNLFFHILNALLLFVFFVYTTGAIWRSFFVAALFAWHPIHVESVAWAAERKDVLSGFFFLLTLIAYSRYVRGIPIVNDENDSEVTPATRNSKLWYGVALLMFALALMSKPMVVTLPFVLLLLDFWPLERVSVNIFARRRSNSASLHGVMNQTSGSFSSLLVEKLPFLLLTVAASAVTYFVQQEGGAVSAIPLSSRLANGLLSYFRYIGKTIWPSELAVYYPLPETFHYGPLLCAGIFLIGITVWFLSQFSRHRYLSIGWFWFLGTLVPVLGLIQVGSQSMADRYTYLPSIGLFWLLVWGIADLISRISFGLKSLNFIQIKSYVPWFGSLVLLFCLAATARQLSYWQNPEKLLQRTISVTRNNYVAYDYLGTALHDKGKVVEAKTCYETSIKICPRFPQAQYNYGTLLLEQGDADAAIPPLRKALTLDSKNANAHQNLADALAKSGNWPEALEHFRRALALKPDDCNLRCIFGTALWNQSEFEDSAAQFREAIRLNPLYVPAHQSLAVALIRLGKRNEAISEFVEAVRLRPSDPELRFNAGLALLESNRAAEAAIQLQAGTELAPNDSRLHYRLAQAFAQQRKNAEAIEEYNLALKAQPNFQEAAVAIARLRQENTN